MAITNVSQFASQAPTSSLTGELQGGSAAQLAALAQALSPSGGNGTNQTYGGASGYQGQGTGTLLNTGGQNLSSLLQSLGSAQPKSYAPSAPANPFGPGTTEQQGLSNYISG